MDQLARRFGVQAATIEKWRELALESIAAGLRQGTAKSASEQEIEKQLKSLERALKDRPSRPGRSPR